MHLLFVWSSMSLSNAANATSAGEERRLPMLISCLKSKTKEPCLSLCHQYNNVAFSLGLFPPATRFPGMIPIAFQCLRNVSCRSSIAFARIPRRRVATTTTTAQWPLYTGRLHQRQQPRCFNQQNRLATTTHAIAVKKGDLKLRCKLSWMLFLLTK